MQNMKLYVQLLVDDQFACRPKVNMYPVLLLTQAFILTAWDEVQTSLMQNIYIGGHQCHSSYNYTNFIPILGLSNRQPIPRSDLQSPWTREGGDRRQTLQVHTMKAPLSKHCRNAGLASHAYCTSMSILVKVGRAHCTSMSISVKRTVFILHWQRFRVTKGSIFKVSS